MCNEMKLNEMVRLKSQIKTWTMMMPMNARMQHTHCCLFCLCCCSGTTVAIIFSVFYIFHLYIKCGIAVVMTKKFRFSFSSFVCNDNHTCAAAVVIVVRMHPEIYNIKSSTNFWANKDMINLRYNVIYGWLVIVKLYFTEKKFIWRMDGLAIEYNVQSSWCTHI